MNKILLLPVLCFLFIFTTKAQQEINTEFANQMETLFAPLEKNRVPHGLLLNYAMDFTNVNAYNGTLTDSTYTDAFRLKQIYNTLLSSRIRNVSDGFVLPQEFGNRSMNSRLAASTTASNTITINGLYFKYAEFNPNALANNKIRYINNQFQDKYINSVWQNPYDEKETFAMSPAIKKFNGYELQVRIPQNTFYSNYQNLVQSIEIDFSDGNGFVTIPFNQNIAVTYTTASVKTWTYKLNLTNGTTLLNQSRIIIRQGLKTIPFSHNRTSQQQNNNTKMSHTITASIPYQGQFGKVKLTIDDAISNGEGIRKPLIVAEGFDVGAFFGPENVNGQNDYIDFRTSIFNGGTELRNLIYNFNKEYDIIYVDWDNGTDYMQRNAFALEAVIEWVNQEKAFYGSTEPNVILGQSMGGVVARYALADMEERGDNHDTRLFISHDAPQQGANMPVSFQYLVRHIENQLIETSQTLFGGLVTIPIIDNNLDLPLALLDQPATKQLIKNWSNLNYGINNNVHDNFYNELKNKGLSGSGGYPINCRNIAISNGSECGTTQDFNAGDHLFNYQDNSSISFLQSLIVPFASALGNFFVDEDFGLVAIVSIIPGSSRYTIDFQANALFNSSGNRIYKGKISYRKKIFWLFPVTVNITNVQINQPSGLLPFDTYGGGFFDMGNVASSLPNGVMVNDKFNFIPTASMLDIGRNNVTLNNADYLRDYVGANPPTGTKASPFDNFSTEFDKTNPNAHNKRHISFNRRNGDWLAGELNSGDDIIYTGCSSFCSETSAQIIGNDYICDNGCDFSVDSHNNLPINWSIIQGSNLVNSTINGNIITLIQADLEQNGQITLSANFGNSECGDKTIIKNIWVGEPKSPTTLNGPEEVQTGTFATYNGGNALGAEIYEWILPYPFDVVEFFDYDSDNWQIKANDLNRTHVSVYTGEGEIDGLVQIMSFNPCNQDIELSPSKNIYVIHADCPPGELCDDDIGDLQPYPNSSDESFKLDFRNKPASTQFYIYLYDQYSNIKYEGASNNVEKTIDTMSLQEGVYYLHVYENGELKTKHIFVSH